MANKGTQQRKFVMRPYRYTDTTTLLQVGDPFKVLLYDGSVRTVTVTAIDNGGRTISWDAFGLPTSTAGSMSGAGSVGALATAGETVAVDARAALAAGVRQEDVVGFDGSHLPTPTEPQIHSGGPYKFGPVVNAE